VRCRLVRTYRCLPLEGTKVGGDQREAKHDGEEDISVDAAVQGASRERTICKCPTNKE
jgi:hypothetical protein